MDTKKYTQSQYLAVQEVKDSKSKVLTVVSEGSEQPDDNNKLKYCCVVEIDGQNRQYRPNRTTLQAMQKVWGFDSCQWVGKRMSLTTAMLGSKEAIIGSPV